MIKTSKYKRIIAFLMLIILFITNSQPIFAASGSGTWAGGQYGSYMRTTDATSSEYGVLIRYLIDLDTMEKKTVFCAEHGVEFTTSVAYNGEFYTPSNSTIKKACKVAYLGWYSKYGDYAVDGGIAASEMYDVKQDYVFTQQYIWEVLGQSYATFLDYNVQSEYENFKNDIENQIADIERRPSFDGETITIQAGESETIFDEYGVFSKYESINTTQDGITFIHNKGENSLTILVDENTNLENYNISDSTFKSWGLIREDTHDNDTMIYFEFGDGIQNQLYSMHYNDPISLRMSLSIESFGKMELQKLNTNGDLINGAIFNVRGPDEYNQDVEVTNGKITLENLKKGTYTIIEKTAPYGYLIDTNAYDVEVEVNQTATEAVVNTEPTGEIKAYKIDDYNNKLKNAEISLYAKEDIMNAAGTITWYRAGELIDSAMTDNNGMAKFTNLHIGHYYVKETKAPDGYLLNNQEFDAELTYKDELTKVIYLNVEGIIDDEPMGEIKAYKIDDYSNKLKDAEISLYAKEDIYNKARTKKFYSAGDLVATNITNDNGVATFSDLPIGHYYVKETKAPDGYLLNNQEFDAELKYKDGLTKVIYLDVEGIIDDEPTGNFILIKKNADKTAVLQNSTWRIWNDNYEQTISTDLNGKFEITGLKLGKYNYQEIDAPDGYLIDENVYEFELLYKDQYTEVVYANAERTNDEPTATITIIKKDSKTGSVPQGDAILTGAVYKVYAKEDIYNKARTKKFYSAGDLVATRTMNENGRTEDITELPLGKYVVKEDTASLGYMLDTREYEVDLVYKDQNTKVISNTTTSLEKVKEMGVHIFKSGIKVNSGETPGLENAEFTIKLNSAVEKAYEQGYTYAEVWNGIDENGNKVNVDADRISQAQVIAPTYEIIKTDKDGNAYTQSNLPYGKFIVKETKTPTDYETAADFTFSITDDETEIQEIAKKTKHIVVNNEQLESYIKIVKKDLKTDKNVTLNSTTFEIKATKDIYDRATKKILFKEGEVISQKIGNTTYSSFTTNADNIVVPDNSFNSTNDNKSEVTTPLKLPVGSYEITEIKVPDGFLQLDTPITFEIKNIKDYDTDKDGDFIKEVIVKNEQPTGTLELDKEIALREDVDTSLVDISDLSGIEFKLTAKEDIIDMADGSKIYNKGQEINKYNLTKDGKLTISELPMGIYEIEETKTLDGLVLNRNKYEVKFTQKDLVTKVYDELLDISNDTTLVEISKTDITGDNELVGANLQVIDDERNVIDEWISAERTHKIEGLSIGKEYILKEEIAPEGYVIATEIRFTIKDTNEIQKVNMKDKIVSMSKVDIGGEEIEGATIQVFDKDNNLVDEWTSTKEEHKIKNLKENETYRLHEEVAPNGFVKATDIEFKVSDKKENEHIELIDKVVEISKEDIAGKEIEGAKLQVLDSEDNVIDEWTSEKEAHKVTGLEEGKTYKLHEEVAIGNYVKASDIEFKVTTDKETQKVTMIDKLVEVTKTDLTNGEELEGAKLEITDEEGNVIDTWTSTKEAHQVKGLEEGKTYILKETTAPYGYETTEEIKFVVTTDKETQKVEMKDMPILKNVKVIKVDSETKETIKDKFTFAIYEDFECTELIKEVKSNTEDGTALFEELRYGTYYIKETKAPKDYELSTKVVKVEINDKGIFVDDEQVEEKENTIEFSFENQKIEVPKTGDESSIKLIGGILILSILGIAYIIIHNHNKKKQD